MIASYSSFCYWEDRISKWITILFSKAALQLLSIVANKSILTWLFHKLILDAQKDVHMSDFSPRLTEFTPKNKNLKSRNTNKSHFLLVRQTVARCHLVVSSFPGKQMCPLRVEKARMSEGSELGVMGYKGGREWGWEREDIQGVEWCWQREEEEGLEKGHCFTTQALQA